jgi:hypothetical protein
MRAARPTRRKAIDQTTARVPGPRPRAYRVEMTIYSRRPDAIALRKFSHYHRPPLLPGSTPGRRPEAVPQRFAATSSDLKEGRDLVEIGNSSYHLIISMTSSWIAV